ncbi:unnamed protein product [Cylicostephanus goldi]|uniref:Profilin n=1 Tax=Cylicostephanus goldi TaxID=71465 RepID=A0A3P6RRN5_CYLGO|nr:unnamed protein product [Cylicostephanus goldi]
MSGWQAYITSMTDSSPAIKRAAIIGTDGSVWARTQNANAFRERIVLVGKARHCMEKVVPKIVFISFMRSFFLDLSTCFQSPSTP